MRTPIQKILGGAFALLIAIPGSFAADEPALPPPPPGKRFEFLREHGPRDSRMHFIDAKDMPKEKVTYLGVETGRVSPTVAAQLGIAERTGLTVLRVVEESPAAGALQKHDILVKFNDQILVNEPQLSVLVRSQKPGDEVSLTILRAGKETKVRVKLAEREVPKMTWRMEGFPEDFDLEQFQFEFGEKAGEWGERAREWAEKAKDMAGRVREDVRQTLRVLGDDGDGPHVFVHEGGPMKRVTRINTDRGNIVLVDDSGRVELKMKDKIRHVIVKDKEGKTLFEGPVTSDADRAALTPEIRERLEKVESMVNVDFELSDDAETKEVVPDVGRSGVAFEREAAPRPVRTYTL